MPGEGGGIVLLAVEGAPTHIVFHSLASELPIAHVVLEKPVSKMQLVRGRLKRLGLPVVAGQLLFQGLAMPVLKKASRARFEEIRRQFGMDESEIVHPSLHRVSSANDASTIELLKRLAPAVVVVQGTRILSRKLLESVNCPFINMHAGLTPLFRGVHGGYWAVATGSPELCGVTVHLVDPGVDTGGILAQAHVPFEPRDCFVTYPYLQLGMGLPLLKKAVREALVGRPSVKSPPAGDSRAWSHPTLWGYTWRRLTRGVR